MSISLPESPQPSTNFASASQNPLYSPTGGGGLASQIQKVSHKRLHG